MAQTVGPVADVAVAEQLVVAGVVQPDVGAESMLQVVFPVAAVALIAGEPVHLAMAVTLIVLPIALIVVLRGVDHLTMAPLHAALPLTRVNGAVLVSELTVAVSHALLPVTLVLDALFLVDVGALTVAEAIENVTFVGAAIWPGVVSLSSDLVLFEFTGVDRAIRPLKDAAAPE